MRLGLWLTLPAQLLVLFIALFPILMQDLHLVYRLVAA